MNKLQGRRVDGHFETEVFGQTGMEEGISKHMVDKNYKLLAVNNNNLFYIIRKAVFHVLLCKKLQCNPKCFRLSFLVCLEQI